ncbi:MAG: serine/threonine protein kinase [Ktedonobacteraceae bacterium]
MVGLEGKTLGRYELHRLVGRGGMADVYQGYDPHFDREVAVKVFKREDEEMLRRFIREAHLMASLHNEHLVQVYDAGQSEIRDITWYYIVMPFMEGGTLRARVRRSPLAPTEACRNLKDIAAALDYIHHQGIVHRDIKSSNVLLDAEGRCYLSDFGIARTTTDVTQVTTTGNVLGTVDYVAPELFEVGRKADARSDFYSLGVLLFEMVTGQLPFSAENQIAVVSMHMHRPPPSPRSISPNISPQVERVIFKALEKKPELRYSSATELADAFCHAIAAGNVNVMASSMQGPPEAVGIKPNQVVLPPILPNAPKSSRLRQVPLAGSRETVPFVPPDAAPRPAPSVPPPASPATPATRPAANLPGGGKRPPSTRSREERRRTLIVALIALLTLLLVIVPIVYVLITQSNSGSPSTSTPTPARTQGATTGTTPTPSPTATPNLTATAHAIAVATATAQAQATATAIAHVTATAQAQASATAGVIQTATAGQPVYQDLLNNPKNAATQAAQWDKNGNCGFQSDGYHVTQGTGFINLRGCRETGNTYKNATLSVDVNLLNGHSGGLFFRLGTDFLGNYSGYLFEVDSQGNYKISTISGGSPTALPGHDWTKTSALKQGYNVKNTLQVIMTDKSFLFYANGIYLTQVTDTTFSAAGDIGFLGTATSTNADVVYSNLTVYPRS